MCVCVCVCVTSTWLYVFIEHVLIPLQQNKQIILQMT